MAAPNLDGFLKWIRRCNTENYAHGLLPFVCEGRRVGYCKPSFAQHLSRFPKVFQVGEKTVTFDQRLNNADQRTSAVAEVLQQLREESVVTGWRNELYPVVDTFHGDPIFLVERAAAVQFGIRSYGVHMNGYVNTETGIKLWVARRAKNKPTWPGKLDHICAGGQPQGISPSENMVKECAEEASIPEPLARKAVPVGAVSYAQLQEQGVKRDCLFCYDLRLPPDFQPTPGDSEVEGFELMDIEAVAHTILTTDDFKDNCNLVIIDFLLRHGVVKPESPGYLELVAGLRQGECR